MAKFKVDDGVPMFHSSCAVYLKPCSGSEFTAYVEKHKLRTTRVLGWPDGTKEMWYKGTTEHIFAIKYLRETEDYRETGKLQALHAIALGPRDFKKYEQ